MHGDFSEGSCALRKRSALIATLWSGGDVLFRQGIQFLTLALLARMLAPSDFGMIAMLSLITGVATVLVDGGLSVALIQRQEVTRADEATLFYFNVSIGLLLTLLIVICAPWIAAFYRAPDLITPARIMALGCLLGSLAPVHTALLTRKLDFATQAKASTLATTASGVIVVVLALQGWGVIALALHGVLMAGFMSAALWWLHPWRPHAGFSFQSLRSLTHFGFFQLGASLLDMIYNRLHTPLLGRLFGARPWAVFAGRYLASNAWKFSGKHGGTGCFAFVFAQYGRSNLNAARPRAIDPGHDISDGPNHARHGCALRCHFDLFFWLTLARRRFATVYPVSGKRVVPTACA